MKGIALSELFCDIVYYWVWFRYVVTAQLDKDASSSPPSTPVNPAIAGEGKPNFSKYLGLPGNVKVQVFYCIYIACSAVAVDNKRRRTSIVWSFPSIKIYLNMFYREVDQKRKIKICLFLWFVKIRAEHA